MSNHPAPQKQTPTSAIVLAVIGVALVLLFNPLCIIGLVLIAISLYQFWRKYFADAPSNRKKLIEYEQKIRKIEAEGFGECISVQDKLNDVRSRYERLTVDYNDLTAEYEKRKHEFVTASKQATTMQKKLARMKELNNAFGYMAEKYMNRPAESVFINGFTPREVEALVPSVMLQIHSMDMNDLRKVFNDNDKTIDEFAASYRARYTTKTNQTIYDLMVIALRAELQIILYDLKYQKLDKGIENVKEVTQKYLSIVNAGNQQLTNTMTMFIGGLEHLFINAVKIEYNYYVRKEQARQEQLEIRERMRQEAEDRRALELERKRIEKEEAKFDAQIAEIEARIKTAAESEIALLRSRLSELEGQKSDIIKQKDTIAELENGKAGNVYIISNLGSFGDHVFKIGMTRRRNPQERIDELGDASVPFGFDVHSFIFSEDAVALETELHHRLEARRVNKVNSRKEFFDISIDELEALTHEISPTAEFRRTMAAEEYRQSLSTEIA